MDTKIENIIKGQISIINNKLDRIEKKVNYAYKSEQVKISDLYTIPNEYGLVGDVWTNQDRPIPRKIHGFGNLIGAIYYNEDTQTSYIITKKHLSSPILFSIKEKITKMWQDSFKDNKTK